MFYQSYFEDFYLALVNYKVDYRSKQKHTARYKLTI